MKAKYVIALMMLMFGTIGVADVTDTDSYDWIKYDCNGSTTGFTYEFRVLQASDLVVIHYDTTTDTATTLTNVTDYTVSVTNNDFRNATGGTVTTTSTYGATIDLIISTQFTMTQLAKMTFRWQPATVEDALDKSRLIDRQLYRNMLRCLRGPEEDDPNIVMKYGNAAERAEKWVGFGADGSVVLSDSITPDNAIVSVWGETIIDDPNAKGGRDTLELDTDDDVEFAAIKGTTGTFSGAVSGTTGTFSGAVSGTTGTFTDLITKGSVFDVRAYGASPSESAANNATYIQAALDAAAIVKGCVLLPPGTFDIDTRLDIPVDIIFSGVGNGSVINYTGAAVAMATRYSSSGDYVQWRSIIRNMRIASDTGTVGILIRNVYGFTVRQVSITYFSAPNGFSVAGIQLDANGVGGSEFVNRIHQCRIKQNDGYGIYFSGQNAHNQIFIDGCWIQGNQKSGIYAEKQIRGVTIIGSEIEGNGGGDIGGEIQCMNGAEGLNIIGNWMETNADNHNAVILSGAGGYLGVNIIGNVIGCNDTGTVPAIYLPGTHAGGYIGLIVKGNKIKGHKYGIDFRSKVYTDCDFTGNYYDVQTSEFYALSASSGAILRWLGGSDTWDVGNLADGAGETKSFTVTGAALGDIAFASVPKDLQDMTVTAYVQAANTVEVRVQNESGGAINLASAIWKVRVLKTL